MYTYFYKVSAISDASVLSSSLCASLTVDLRVAFDASTVIFFIFATISPINLADIGAQLPFSMNATVLFCRLCAARSRSSVSIGVNIPALYVGAAKTICEHLNASDIIYDGCVTDTSVIAIFLIPFFASSDARIFAAFSVPPYIDAYAIRTVLSSGV